MNSDRFLDDLINPEKHQNTFNLNSISKKDCEDLYRKLTFIREVEFKIAEKRKTGEIGGPVHLAAGQEAIPVGISYHLTNNDYIFGAHRSHAHILALGSSLIGLFAELLGRSTGLSKGYGGSMHLIDKSVGFMGSVPIVAGTISLAVGAGFAISQKNSKSVSIAYIGDGGVEEGVFHESLNLASINNLPVIFVVENNLFSSHMDINKRQPSSFTARFAKANLINHKIIDGNNIIEVINTSKDIIKKTRENKKPGLIEAFTYRWFGHVDWREDIDVGTNRCRKSLNNWKLRCPIKRLKESLIKENILDQSILDKIRNEIINEINNAWEIALKEPLQKKNDLLKNIYFEKK